MGDQNLVVAIRLVGASESDQPDPLCINPENLASWRHFESLIACMYRYPPDATRVKYLDDEKDWVELGSDAELSEAVRMTRESGEILQLQVERIDFEDFRDTVDSSNASIANTNNTAPTETGRQDDEASKQDFVLYIPTTDPGGEIFFDAPSTPDIECQVEIDPNKAIPLPFKPEVEESGNGKTLLDLDPSECLPPLVYPHSNNKAEEDHRFTFQSGHDPFNPFTPDQGRLVYPHPKCTETLTDVRAPDQNDAEQLIQTDHIAPPPLPSSETKPVSDPPTHEIGSNAAQAVANLWENASSLAPGDKIQFLKRLISSTYSTPGAARKVSTDKETGVIMSQPGANLADLEPGESLTDQEPGASLTDQTDPFVCTFTPWDEDELEPLFPGADSLGQNSLPNQDPFDIESDGSIDRIQLHFENDKSPTLTPVRANNNGNTPRSEQRAASSGTSRNSSDKDAARPKGTVASFFDAFALMGTKSSSGSAATYKTKSDSKSVKRSHAPESPADAPQSENSRVPVPMPRNLHIMAGAQSGANAVAIEMPVEAEVFHNGMTSKDEEIAASGGVSTTASEETGETVLRRGGSQAATVSREMKMSNEEVICGAGAGVPDSWSTNTDVVAFSSPIATEKASMNPAPKKEKDAKKKVKRSEKKSKPRKEKAAKIEKKACETSEKKEDGSPSPPQLHKSTSQKDKENKEEKVQRQKSRENVAEDVESGELVNVKPNSALHYNDFVKHMRKVKKDIHAAVVKDVGKQTEKLLRKTVVRWNDPQNGEMTLDVDPSESSKSVRHVSIYCDSCNRDIMGIRYKCGNCLDFDLCEKCEAIPDIHTSTHVFLKLRVPIRNAGWDGKERFSLLKENIYEAEQGRKTEMEREFVERLACLYPPQDMESQLLAVGALPQSEKVEAEAEAKSPTVPIPIPARPKVENNRPLCQHRQAEREAYDRMYASAEPAPSSSFDLTMARGIDSGMSKIGQAAEERLDGVPVPGMMRIAPARIRKREDPYAKPETHFKVDGTQCGAIPLMKLKPATSAVHAAVPDTPEKKSPSDAQSDAGSMEVQLSRSPSPPALPPRPASLQPPRPASLQPPRPLSPPALPPRFKPALPLTSTLGQEGPSDEVKEPLLLKETAEDKNELEQSEENTDRNRELENVEEMAEEDQAEVSQDAQCGVIPMMKLSPARQALPSAPEIPENAQCGVIPMMKLSPARQALPSAPEIPEISNEQSQCTSEDEGQDEMTAEKVNEWMKQSLARPLETNMRKEWHQTIPFEVRRELISRYLKSVCPELSDPLSSETYDIMDRAKKEELFVFENADGMEDYLHSLRKKIEELQLAKESYKENCLARDEVYSEIMNRKCQENTPMSRANRKQKGRSAARPRLQVLPPMGVDTDVDSNDDVDGDNVDDVEDDDDKLKADEEGDRQAEAASVGSYIDCDSESSDFCVIDPSCASLAEVCYDGSITWPLQVPHLVESQHNDGDADFEYERIPDGDSVVSSQTFSYGQPEEAVSLMRSTSEPNTKQEEIKSKGDFDDDDYATVANATSENVVDSADVNANEGDVENQETGDHICDTESVSSDGGFFQVTHESVIGADALEGGNDPAVEETQANPDGVEATTEMKGEDGADELEATAAEENKEDLNVEVGHGLVHKMTEEERNRFIQLLKAEMDREYEEELKKRAQDLERELKAQKERELRIILEAKEQAAAFENEKLEWAEAASRQENESLRSFSGPSSRQVSVSSIMSESTTSSAVSSDYSGNVKVGETKDADCQTLPEAAPRPTHHHLIHNVASGVSKAASSAYHTAKDVFYSLQAKQNERKATNSNYKPPQSAWTPPPDTYKVPTSSWVPPSDLYVPPQDSYVPPKNTYVPPENKYTPPSNTYVPPKSNWVPKKSNFVPPNVEWFKVNSPINAPTSTSTPGADTAIPQASSSEFSRSVPEQPEGQTVQKKSQDPQLVAESQGNNQQAQATSKPDQLQKRPSGCHLSSSLNGGSLNSSSNSLTASTAIPQSSPIDTLEIADSALRRELQGMQRLIEMGFANREKNRQLLNKFDGDLEKVVQMLVQEEGETEDDHWAFHRH